MRRVLLALSALAVVGYLATGVFIVQPNEKVVVRRFGKPLDRPLEPGLHLELPWGMSKIDRVRVDETRQVTIGSQLPVAEWEDRLEEVDEAARGRFVTGDQNIVNLGLTVQYAVSDPQKFLLGTTGAERFIGSAAQSLLSEKLATLPVDEVLLGAQGAMGADLAGRLQQILDDRYELGVIVRSVNFTGISPPAEVADAFNDVVNARNDKDKKVNDAYSDESRTKQQAQGRAEELRNQAESYAQKRQAEGRGQANRFREMLSAYQQSSAPSSVRRRLLLETMEEVLPRTKKVLVGADNDSRPIDLSILRSTPE